MTLYGIFLDSILNQIALNAAKYFCLHSEDFSEYNITKRLHFLSIWLIFYGIEMWKFVYRFMKIKVKWLAVQERSFNYSCIELRLSFWIAMNYIGIKHCYIKDKTDTLFHWLKQIHFVIRLHKEGCILEFV